MLEAANWHYNTWKQHAVGDVSTVKEFLQRYYRRERIDCHLADYPSYFDTLLTSYESDFKSYGCCWISRHDNITGDVVSFYGQTND